MSILSFAKKILGRNRKKATIVKPVKKAIKTKSLSKVVTVKRVAESSIMVQLIPSLTEKGVAMQMASNTYTFRVNPKITKGQIFSAFETKYHIRPLRVRTAQRSGKHRQRGRTQGFTRTWKRAYITLPLGKSLDVSV